MRVSGIRHRMHVKVLRIKASHYPLVGKLMCRGRQHLYRVSLLLTCQLTEEWSSTLGPSQL